MFCDKCGKPIREGARFCPNCGAAITHNVSRSTMSIGNNQIKDGINIFFPDGHNELGYALISTTEIIVFKKSQFVIAAFGLIGSLFDKGRETIRINITDIAYAYKEKFRLNKNAYYIKMKNGATYILCFDKHKTTIPYLESIIGHRQYT